MEERIDKLIRELVDICQENGLNFFFAIEDKGNKLVVNTWGVGKDSSIRESINRTIEIINRK